MCYCSVLFSSFGPPTFQNLLSRARFWIIHRGCDGAATDPLTDSPPGHSAAQGFNAADYFMAGIGPTHMIPFLNLGLFKKSIQRANTSLLEQVNVQAGDRGWSSTQHQSPPQ